MSRIVKLSKDQWMQVGVEMGFLKEADAAVPVVLSLHSRLQDIVAKLDRMGSEDLRHPKLEAAAEKLHGDLVRFESLLDTHGS